MKIYCRHRAAVGINPRIKGISPAACTLNPDTQIMATRAVSFTSFIFLGWLRPYEGPGDPINLNPRRNTYYYTTER